MRRCLRLLAVERRRWSIARICGPQSRTSSMSDCLDPACGVCLELVRHLPPHPAWVRMSAMHLTLELTPNSTWQGSLRFGRERWKDVKPTSTPSSVILTSHHLYTLRLSASACPAHNAASTSQTRRQLWRSRSRLGRRSARRTSVRSQRSGPRSVGSRSTRTSSSASVWHSDAV